MRHDTQRRFFHPGRAGLIALVLLVLGLAALQRNSVASAPTTYLSHMPVVVRLPSSWQLQSPDGHLSVNIYQSPYDGRLYQRVAYAGVPLLEDSLLGLTMAGFGGDFRDTLRYVTSEQRSLAEQFSPVAGKRSQVTAQANELTLRFVNAAGRPVELVFRAYNDGTAFRYVFPGPGSYAVSSESTSFRVPAAARAWAHWWQPNYEQKFGFRTPADLDGSNGPAQWGQPVLLGLPGDHWALLTEAASYGHYAVQHFSGAGNRTLRLTFPPDQTGPVTGELPLATPWRVVIAGSGLASIVESDLVQTLNPPPAFADTSWIRPGRVAWSWWAYTRSPQYLAIQKDYVDLAATMGWEYVLVDEGWNPAWVPELVDYARARGIAVILWSRATEFDETDAKQWAAWGVRGAKLDFIDSDNQAALRDQYDRLYELTARYRLMLNFHGASRPAGEQRRWPHQLTREAVRGAEYRDLSAIDNINLVFTRNVIGPMDYTPVVLSRPKGTWDTSFANQLALAVLFESGWQHFPDRPEHYLESPGRELLQSVPAAWDETRLLAGYPDEYVILARRSGDSWFVGANSVMPRRVFVPLDFLSGGRSYQATVWRDGSSINDVMVQRQTVSAGDTLVIDMRTNGGFAIRLTP